MPEHWHDRMETITTYEQDASAVGRLNGWRYAINLASDRVTGGGFVSWSQYTFDKYAPPPADVNPGMLKAYKPKSTHSIYFGVLADHGWIGLAFFLAIGILTWRLGSSIIRACKAHDDLRWADDLAKMVQVSLVAYASGGAFLSMAYFDLPWHMVSVMVILNLLVQQHLNETAGVSKYDSVSTNLARKETVASISLGKT